MDGFTYAFSVEVVLDPLGIVLADGESSWAVETRCETVSG